LETKTEEWSKYWVKEGSSKTIEVFEKAEKFNLKWTTDKADINKLNSMKDCKPSSKLSSILNNIAAKKFPKTDDQLYSLTFDDANKTDV